MFRDDNLVQMKGGDEEDILSTEFHWGDVLLEKNLEMTYHETRPRKTSRALELKL